MSKEKELSEEWKWDYLPNEQWYYDKTEPEYLWYFMYPSFENDNITIGLEEMREVNK